MYIEALFQVEVSQFSVVALPLTAIVITCGHSSSLTSLSEVCYLVFS